MTENGFLLEIAALEEKKSHKSNNRWSGTYSSRFCKNKISLYQSYTLRNDLIKLFQNKTIVVTIIFIPTLSAYICSKSDWSHISSQIFRFAVFYPTQQGIQHTPDFSPLCFIFQNER